jgi:hypothetical protein
MKQQTKFSQAQQETNAAQQNSRNPAGREFASAEELLRFDAQQTAVPPDIARRLQKSADQPPPSPPAKWWQRLF